MASGTELYIHVCIFFFWNFCFGFFLRLLLSITLSAEQKMRIAQEKMVQRGHKFCIVRKGTNYFVIRKKVLSVLIITITLNMSLKVQQTDNGVNIFSIHTHIQTASSQIDSPWMKLIHWTDVPVDIQTLQKWRDGREWKER